MNKRTRMNDEAFEEVMATRHPADNHISAWRNIQGELRRARESETRALAACKAALASFMDPNAGQADTLRLLRAAIEAEGK